MADNEQKVIKVENMEPTDAINALQRTGIAFCLKSGMADGRSRYEVTLTNAVKSIEVVHENFMEAIRSAYHQLMGIETTPAAQVQAEEAALTETPAPVEAPAVSEPVAPVAEEEVHTLSLGDAGAVHEQA